MVVSMEGLVKRGTVFIYRRDVPKRLRGIIGKREIKLSLDTSDLGVAERRWSSVKAKVDQMLAEAEKGLLNPSVAVYKVLQGWRESNGDSDPASKREIGLDFHLTSLLDPEWQDQPLWPEKRAVAEALLKRQPSTSQASNGSSTSSGSRGGSWRKPRAARRFASRPLLVTCRGGCASRNGTRDTGEPRGTPRCMSSEGTD